MQYTLLYCFDVKKFEASLDFEETRLSVPWNIPTFMHSLFTHLSEKIAIYDIQQFTNTTSVLPFIP